MLCWGSRCHSYALTAGTPEEELTLTVNAQPALLTISIACLAAFKEAAPNTFLAPSYMAGHSLGEYSALTAAGALSFETAVNLSRERGRLMYEAGLEQPGTMAAIIALDKDTLAEVCEETGAYLANMNCPGQIVISGTKEAVKTASKLARTRGAKIAVPLEVSGAFHSPLIKSAQEKLAPQIMTAEVKAPDIPVIGNTEAQILDSADSIRSELCDQVCHCVEWENTVRYLLNQGVDTFVEIGPGQVLTGMIKRIDTNAKAINIGSMEDIEALSAHLGGT